MVLHSLPVLITSGDLLPGGGELNGRRWAGQQLVALLGSSCWIKAYGLGSCQSRSSSSNEALA